MYSSENGTPEAATTAPSTSASFSGRFGQSGARVSPAPGPVTIRKVSDTTLAALQSTQEKLRAFEAASLEAASKSMPDLLAAIQNGERSSGAYADGMSLISQTAEAVKLNASITAVIEHQSPEGNSDLTPTQALEHLDNITKSNERFPTLAGAGAASNFGPHTMATVELLHQARTLRAGMPERPGNGWGNMASNGR